MISQDRFEERLKWLSNVTGSMVRKETSEYLWEELKDCDIKDFHDGTKALAYTDEKINLANLLKHISKYQSKRMEQENLEFKRNEEEEHRKWWREHRGTRQTCVNEYKCFSCKREYCDVIAVDSVECIKGIVMGDMTPEDMNNRMAKYKGMGWIDKALEPF